MRKVIPIAVEIFFDAPRIDDINLSAEGGGGLHKRRRMRLEKWRIKYDYGETEEVSEIINKITKEMSSSKAERSVRHTSGDFLQR